MKLGSLVMLLSGLLLAVSALIWVGAEPVIEATLAVGFTGILAITAFNLVTMGICALGWRALVQSGMPRGLPLMLWARFLRGSLSELVPISGELVSIRVLALHGMRTSVAGASMVVDLTLELASQIGFTALGLGLLAFDGRADTIIGYCLVGLCIGLAALVGFVGVQHRGGFRWIERLPHRLAERLPWARLPELAGLNQELQGIYRRRRAVIPCLLWHTLGWIVGIGEAWLALWFLNSPLPFADLLIIESLSFALKSAAFAIPGALGVQELGYLALGAMFGLPGEVALALALLKRAREIVLAVVALAGWKFVELSAWRRGRLAWRT